MRQLMLFCGIFLLSSSIATASTVAFWEFDEKSPGETADTTPGAIIDQTGNYDCTVTGTGSQVYVEGDPNYSGGSALNFDPANLNAVSVPTNSTLDNLLADGTSATVEMLIRTTDTDFQRLVTKQKVYENGFWYLGTMSPEHNGALRFESVATDHPNSYRDVRGTTCITDGEWHHVALVLDSTTYPGQTNINLYVDYYLDASDLGPTLGLNTNTENMIIGERPDHANPFAGDMDFMRLSNVALDPTELVNYESPEPPPPPALPKHVGSTDPTEGRFVLDGDPGTGVTDDLNVDAWNVSNGFSRYRAMLNNDELDAMASDGWSAKMTVRNMLTDDDGTDWGLHLEASDRTHTYMLLIGSDASDNPTLHYLSSFSGYTQEEISLTGISGGGYHDYELVYDPDNPGMVDVFVDDILQASINGADNTSKTAYQSRFCFGSTDGAAVSDANYSLVELSSEKPIPGDANRDGKVDADDAALLATNWLTHTGASWSMGDFNDDGAVDDIDATILATNWHTGVSAASVPEPGTISLFCFGLIMLLWKRRR